MTAVVKDTTWNGCVRGLPVASAPISWGACELPGWGPMPDAETVLAEMAALGLRGTELGPPGFLADTPEALRDNLARHDLQFVGTFVPLVLHTPDLRPALDAARAAIDLLQRAGGDVLVGAIVEDVDWSDPRPLDDTAWRHLAQHAARVAELCAEHGLRFSIHPHVGTLLLQAADIERAIAETGPEVSWCLDTGHLAVGGTDPARFAVDHGDRVNHVHIKDVNAALAEEVRAGRVSLLEATGRGLFTPLGDGVVDIDTVMRALRDQGYDGWIVLEQDTISPLQRPADAPRPLHDAERSVQYLQEVTA